MVGFEVTPSTPSSSSAVGFHSECRRVRASQPKRFALSPATSLGVRSQLLPPYLLLLESGFRSGSLRSQSRTTAAVQDWLFEPRGSPVNGSKYSAKPLLSI